MNGKMKKLLSVLLSVFMIAGLVPMIALPEAGAATSTWDGSVTTSFSGSGTAASPYIIDTAAKLAGVAALGKNATKRNGFFVQYFRPYDIECRFSL